tara:strand:- start:3668 stop:4747 length:1080 start_codon:yes stop_codon:yes gene_type:complete
MIKFYHKHLLKNYLDSLFQVSIIFFCLVFILNVFEEVTFFKNTDTSFAYPLLITFLNTPSVFFEISPFIFFISTQFFFINLINKNELTIYKYYGFDNFKLISLICSYSLIIGIIFILFFYNLSSQLKFLYLDLKNDYTEDNKYLAMVTDNGLWIKDETDNFINIINADKIDNNYLINVSIIQFDNDFNFIRSINSKTADIKDAIWVINDANISSADKNNQIVATEYFKTNFNLKKISELYSDLGSLTLWSLEKLKDDYKKLGYSTLDVKIHQQKIYSYFLYFAIMTVLSSILMLNVGYNKSKIFHIIIGILLSVIIYYMNFFLKTLGESQKIPYLIAVWLPLVILSIVSLIGLVRINEK